jgi:hypothetical protein
MVDKLSNMNTGGGGYGGGGSFGPEGSQPDFSQMSNKEMKAKIKELEQKERMSMFVPSILPPFNFNGGGVRQKGDEQKYADMYNKKARENRARQIEIQQLEILLGKRKELDEALSRPFKEWTAEDFLPKYFVSIIGYAKGTPNTSREGMPKTPDGGMITKVHDNEAIIPLPDGRSVPVNIRGGGGSGREASRQSQPSGPITLNVNMNVEATDASSFKRTKGQIMQDLTVEMRRALRNIGEPESSDLSRPTRRGPHAVTNWK